MLYGRRCRSLPFKGRFCQACGQWLWPADEGCPRGYREPGGGQPEGQGGSVFPRYSGVEVDGLDIPDAQRIGRCGVKVGVTEAEGITASAVEALEVKVGVSLAKRVMSELKAGRHREARTAC